MPNVEVKKDVGVTKKVSESAAGSVVSVPKYSYIKSLSRLYYSPLKIFKTVGQAAFDLGVKPDVLRVMVRD